MPRDASGIFSLPPQTLVNTGDTILPIQHNPAMQDIEQALTGSLPRNGSASMLADLPMNNNRVTGLADGVSPGDAATVRQIAAGGVPIGGVIDFWGDEPPTNFMFPAGQEIARADFSELFSVIGTAAGAGNGSTTFNLPDYRGVVSAGRADMGGTLKSLLSNFNATVLGAIFGSQDHELTVGEMPAHTHTGTTNSAGNHTHSFLNGGGGESPFTSDAGSGGSYSGRMTSAGAHTHSFTTSSRGSDMAHNNVQPTIICNKIIRVR